MFNKDGQPTRRKFRVYCDHDKCNKYIIGKWGGGYACVQTKEGYFDWRNQVWICDEHQEAYEKKNVIVEDLIKRGG